MRIAFKVRKIYKIDSNQKYFHIEGDLGTFRIIFDWFKEKGFQQGLINSYASKRGDMICDSLQSYAFFFICIFYRIYALFIAD